MDYTYGQNGKWEVTKWASHKNIHISVKDEHGCDMYRFIANCGNPDPDSLPHNPNAEGNANLIVAAVNACIKLNTENPLAVAESIGDMYEALKLANLFMKALRTQQSNLFNDFRVVMLETTIEQALDKIKGAK